MGARIGAIFAISAPLVLRVHLDALAPLDRVIVQEAGTQVWQLSPVSASVGVELGIQF
jgi:hypothetical protein